MVGTGSLVGRDELAHRRDPPALTILIVLIEIELTKNRALTRLGPIV